MYSCYRYHKVTILNIGLRAGGTPGKGGWMITVHACTNAAKVELVSPSDPLIRALISTESFRDARLPYPFWPLLRKEES